MKKLISFILAAVVMTAAMPLGIEGTSRIPAAALAADAAKTGRSYSDSEELKALLVSPDGSFSGGEGIDGTKYKTDVKLGAGYNGSSDMLIVYGLESTDQIGEVLTELGGHGYMMAGDPEDYCGCVKTIGYFDQELKIQTDRLLHIQFFVKDRMPGFMTAFDLFDEYDLVEATKAFGFDPAPYVFGTIAPGDADNDGKVTAADASLTLAAYAELMTGAAMDLNMTIFDYNDDGAIDAADSSEMLETYADNMTSVK
ncbi:MAG: hypothetical protein IJ071_09325 [Ruminococcus sp.]|nr:hypothetical protein [Ruminococcus sp.]